MRRKLIIVNATIVLIVGLLAYLAAANVLVEAEGAGSLQRARTARALEVANTQLTSDALLAERWLSELAVGEAVRSVFLPGSPDARSRAATNQANAIVEAAKQIERFRGMRPSLVLFVDSEGTALGRNDAALMRGDSMLATYPSLAKALRAGQPGSALWKNQERQEQLFVSFAPVRGVQAEVVGVLILGTPVNDDRLERASQLAGGVPLALIVGDAVLARTSGFPAPVLSPLLGSGLEGAMARGVDGYVLSAAALSEIGEPGARWLAVLPETATPFVLGLLLPIAAATLLGLVLVLIAGLLLGVYISRPIAQLEEGLLQIINGDTALRFELKHPELGGLASRINSVLNALTGVSDRDDGSD